MPLELGQRAPYATAKTIISVLEKQRAIGLMKIDQGLLERIGVTESLVPRTLATLTILDFTDEDGNPTEEFRRLPNLTEGDFKQAVADMLRTAYAPVLQIIGDPASVAPKAIEDAFRGFSPTGQIDRMVQLFMGLMIYVGLMPEDARRKSPAVAARPLQRPLKGSSGGRILPKRQFADAPPLIVKPDRPASDHRSERPLYSQSVTLASGAGTVTLSYDVNLFDLNDDDEAFLLGLIKSLKGYRNAAQPVRDETPGGDS